MQSDTHMQRKQTRTSHRRKPAQLTHPPPSNHRAVSKRSSRPDARRLVSLAVVLFLMAPAILASSCESPAVGTASSALVGGNGSINTGGSPYVNIGGCSGVMVRNQWALTNSHCFNSSAPLSQTLVTNNVGESAAVDWVEREHAFDIAIVHLSAPLTVNGMAEGYELEALNTDIGSLVGHEFRIYGLGPSSSTAAGDWARLKLTDVWDSEGRSRDTGTKPGITGFTDSLRFQIVAPSTAGIENGDSGSAIVDEQGRLVGIHRNGGGPTGWAYYCQWVLGVGPASDPALQLRDEHGRRRLRRRFVPGVSCRPTGRLSSERPWGGCGRGVHLRMGCKRHAPD